MRSEGEILNMVERAWAGAMPGSAFELNQSWDGSGIDSLKMLTFMLTIERAMGRRIGFDAMTPQSTPADLIALLKAAAKGDAAKPSGQFQMFLVPGALGDEPRLAAFRAAFVGEVTFKTLALPDLGDPVACLADMTATADRLATEIMRIQPEGDLLLAGYSFGGLAACEAVRQLQARGRVVSLLVVLDGVLPSGCRSPSAANYQSIFERVFAILLALYIRIFLVFMRIGAFDVFRRLLRQSTRGATAQLSHRMIRSVLWRLRHLATVRWRLPPIGVSSLLVTSEEFPGATLPLWRDAISDLRVVRVSSDHWGLFEPAPMQIIAPAIRDALALVLDRRGE